MKAAVKYMLLAGALLLSIAACRKTETPMSLRVVLSEITRNPEASYIDGLEGKLKWNYTTGLELKAMLDVYLAMEEIPGQARNDYNGAGILEYVDAWYDAIIAEDGTIYKYKKSNFSTDHVCPGRTLFDLYELTGKPKYRAAMDILYDQLKDQPRTAEGGFWHKQIYPHQMWLDGLYMAQPFYAEYTARYVDDTAEREAGFHDIAHQFQLVRDHTYDPETGLLRHAWDSSHEMFWCDRVTGQSAHSWGRAMGWYAMALVDVIPLLPEGHDKQTLIDILQGIFPAILEHADPESHMWYQVLDRPGEEGNYIEATCSAMFVYALLKGTRLGWLDCITREEAETLYADLLHCFVRTDEDGLVNLDHCCEVAGLGGRENRSGDYTYYINERVRSNDPKGIGPLIWAALEMERQ